MKTRMKKEILFILKTRRFNNRCSKTRRWSARHFLVLGVFVFVSLLVTKTPPQVAGAQLVTK